MSRQTHITTLTCAPDKGKDALPTSVGVIGLGAIGGSVAWQAKQAGIPTVLGWSPEPAERVAAVKCGALDDAPQRAEEVARRVALLVLAAPPAANLALLESLAPHLDAAALVTDTGSVKRSIVALAEQRRLQRQFAGSHPLAGSHLSGFQAAKPDLLVDAIVYVTPAQGGEAAAREIAHFWETACRARSVLIAAEHHDALVAITSHVPQAVSSLLARFLAHAAPQGSTLGAGARDTTRLAAGNPDLWAEILLLNRDKVLPALRALEEPLGELQRALEEGNAGAVREWLASAATWRRSLEA